MKDSWRSRQAAERAYPAQFGGYISPLTSVDPEGVAVSEPAKAGASRLLRSTAGARRQSQGEDRCHDAGDAADEKACQADLVPPSSITTAGVAVGYCLHLAEPPEVEHAARPESGAEPEPRLEIARRRNGRGQGNDQPQKLWRVERHQNEEQDDVASRPTCPAIRRRAISSSRCCRCPAGIRWFQRESWCRMRTSRPS